ncbi:protein kinase STUNTED-like [Andrographis paniculata]|uniref:protein kinase STUNTED-like n=1 Tax=Andrographis paniculata TaxID=175694 RepID=UPI0021E7939B|nr:protein kinase STUNTED-like [Andrographis paniculata]
MTGGGENSAVIDGEGLPDAGGGAVVVVGITLDTRSKELLTWALVKVAQSGDRVIALHIIDPKADTSNLLELMKTFNSMLSAYEGFCSLKQIDLKLKVCKGSPIRKLLSQEAKSCAATSLILGTSEIHHRIKSRISVAKYCAKSLPKNVSVLCVENGKIIFHRESNDSSGSLLGHHGKLESRFERKALPKSPLSLPPKDDLLAGNENLPMALVPIRTHSPQCKSGWPLLRRMLLHSRRSAEASSPKTPSLVQRMLKWPSRQSVAAIYPDRKNIPPPEKDECHSDKEPDKDAAILHSADSDSHPCSSNAFSEELKALGQKYSTICRVFSYQELSSATNKFISENLIGSGGSSCVYRGSLPRDNLIAVKVLKPSEDVLKHFTSEIEIITSLCHKNIISLLGFCFEEDKLLLVYNLFAKGSLEENLHGTANNEILLGWEHRYKVALGVAAALDHLHKQDKPIMHGDVKSSNILLSDDFEPQLCDFGLATRASNYSSHVCGADVAGTFGYLAPEYFMHGKVNEKVDSFAFGVVLLELLSGRKPIDNGLPKGQQSLVMWAKNIFKDSAVSELRDPNLSDSYDCNQFETMLLAAMLCIRSIPLSRPEMSVVLKLLEGDPELIEWARRETKNYDDLSVVSGKQSATNIQSFINLALLDLEDDSASISSTEQSISVEDYLGGRWSRSSSFD